MNKSFAIHAWIPAISGLVVIAMALPLSGFSQDVQKAPLTIKQAVMLALETNLTVQSSRQERHRAQGMVTEATAGMLPQLTAHGNYQHMNRLPYEMGQNDNYSASVGVTQPLYAGGQITAARQAAKAYQRVVENQIQNTEEDTVLHVYTAFYTVLLAREDVAVAEDAVQLGEENLSSVSRKFEQGVARKFDVLRAEEQLSQSQADLIRAQNGLAIRRSNLFNLLRLAPDSSMPIDGTLTFESYGSNESNTLEDAFSNRADLRALKTNLLVQRERITMAKAGMRPAIGLMSEASYGNPDHMGTDEWEDDWAAGVAVTVPLFDGARTRGKVAQEQTTLNQYQLAIEQLKEQISLQITQALLDLQSAEKSVTARARNLDQAKEALRLAQTGYDQGINQQLDVLDAQMRFTTARRTYAIAVYNHIISKAQLERAKGILLDQLQQAFLQDDRTEDIAS